MFVIFCPDSILLTLNNIDVTTPKSQLTVYSMSHRSTANGKNAFVSFQYLSDWDRYQSLMLRHINSNPHEHFRPTL